MKYFINSSFKLKCETLSNRLSFPTSKLKIYFKSIDIVKSKYLIRNFTVTNTNNLDKGFNNKISIKTNMVEKNDIKQIEEIIKDRTFPETSSMLQSLNRTDFLMPEVEKVKQKQTTFGNRIRIVNLVEKTKSLEFVDKTLTIGGWAKSIREQGKGEFVFVELNDGSSQKGVQVVVTKNVEGFDKLILQGVGACLKFTGLIIKSQGSKQDIEMQVNDNEKHSLKVVGECNPSEYILHKSKPSLETLRSICHLRPRTNAISCVSRIRNSLSYATHQFFQKRGFLYVHTPIVTASDCEGAGEMFQVTTILPKPNETINEIPLTKEGKIDYEKDFFKKPSFLTVSGQLAVENYACALSDVYTFGPTFRAEDSHTTRHLSEFWMIEPEMCFADIFDDMECAENYLKFCLKYVLENNMDDLEFFDSFVEKGLVERLRNVVDNDFKKIPYTECIEILTEAVKKDKKLFLEDKKKEKKEEKKEDKKDKKEKKEEKKGDKKEEVTVTQETDNNSDVKTTEIKEEKTEDKKEEKELKKDDKKQEKDKKKEEKKEEKKEDKRNIFWGMDLASEHEKYLTDVVFKKPIIVYNYPASLKSFYMRVNEDQKTVAAMDILVPKIGEIIGGSQREERYDVLLQKIKEKGLDEKSYWWYLDLRKYGSVPHSGFGLGFERLVMMSTGIENIRDVIPYPRYPTHAEF